MTSLRAGGRSARHIENAERLSQHLCKDCGFKTLRDIDASRVESWLAEKLSNGMSARTRNSYLQAISAACEWCMKNGRITCNPLKTVSKADEQCDRRRTRRSLTEDELGRLLYAARWRPLAEHGRDGQDLKFECLDGAVERAKQRLVDHPGFVAKLDLRGRERQLLYKVMLLTGLRKSELASVCVRHLELNSPRPYLILDAKSEKNRRGNSIPLRSDLVSDLNEWLADRAASRQRVAINSRAIQIGRIGGTSEQKYKTGPQSFPDEPLFHVPTQLVRIFDADIKVAGIPKRDDRGRTVDIHALRTTFGTHLSIAGVSLRTAQAAMRHSSPNLTANVYTDPRLLDIHGAVEALPTLTLNSTKSPNSEAMVANGAFGVGCEFLGPTLGPTCGQTGQTVSFTDNIGGVCGVSYVDSGLPESAYKTAVTLAFSNEVREGGLEPPYLAVPDPKSGASANFATPAAGRFLAE